MNIPVMIGSREVFEQALEAARATRYAPNTVDLNSVADAALLGRFSDAWDTIEYALRKGYEIGRNKAKAALDEAIAQAEQLLSQAGDRAGDVQDLLLQHLQQFVQKFITGALTLLPSTVTIGTQNYKIAKVTCTQKVLMTGSIQASLTTVFALASSGELGVAVDYTVA